MCSALRRIHQFLLRIQHSRSSGVSTMSTNSTIVFPDPVLPLSNNNNNKVKDTANPDYPVVKSTADEKLSKVSSLSDPSSSCDGSSTVESEPSDSPDVTLKDLSILQVCQLLENQNLHSIKEVVVENEISGTVLSVSIDTVEDLKEIGIKPLLAKTLFKLIGEWKTQGLPADFLKDLMRATGSGATAQARPKECLINLVPSEVEIERWYTAARLCGDTNACPLLIAAAEKGSHLAEACLTILYTHGCNGLAKDADNALVYAQRSLPWLLAEVAKGNRYAQYLLGFCYFDGTGVSKNELEAIRLFKMAADQGFANAQCYLGWCYTYGSGVAKDLSTAVRLYRLAADQGYAHARCNLGHDYADGTGVIKDEVEAFKLYKQAADQGHVGAICSLGVCFYNGTGVPRDYPEAFRLFNLSAGLGSADAQGNLGLCYRYGKGVSEDISEAKRYYKLAADQGHEWSKKQLSSCP